MTSQGGHMGGSTGDGTIFSFDTVHHTYTGCTPSTETTAPIRTASSSSTPTAQFYGMTPRRRQE